MIASTNGTRRTMMRTKSTTADPRSVRRLLGDTPGADAGEGTFEDGLELILGDRPERRDDPDTHDDDQHPPGDVTAFVATSPEHVEKNRLEAELGQEQQVHGSSRNGLWFW